MTSGLDVFAHVLQPMGGDQAPMAPGHHDTTEHDGYWVDHQERWATILTEILEPTYRVAEAPWYCPVDFVIGSPRGLVFLDVKGKMSMLNTNKKDKKPTREVWVDYADYLKFKDIMREWDIKVVVLLSYRDGAGLLDLSAHRPVKLRKTDKSGFTWTTFDRKSTFIEIPNKLWEPRFHDFKWDECPTPRVCPVGGPENPAPGMEPAG